MATENVGKRQRKGRPELLDVDLKGIRGRMAAVKLGSLARHSGVSAPSLILIRDGVTRNPGVMTLQRIVAGLEGLEKELARRDAARQAAGRLRSAARELEKGVGVNGGLRRRARRGVRTVGRAQLKEVEEYRSRVWGTARGQCLRITRVAALPGNEVIEALSRHGKGEYLLADGVVEALRLRAMELGLAVGVGEVGE